MKFKKFRATIDRVDERKNIYIILFVIYTVLRRYFKFEKEILFKEISILYWLNAILNFIISANSQTHHVAFKSKKQDSFTV